MNKKQGVNSERERKKGRMKNMVRWPFKTPHSWCIQPSAVKMLLRQRDSEASPALQMGETFPSLSFPRAHLEKECLLSTLTALPCSPLLHPDISMAIKDGSGHRNAGVAVKCSGMGTKGLNKQKKDFQGEPSKCSAHWIAPPGLAESSQRKRNRFWPKRCGARYH